MTVILVLGFVSARLVLVLCVRLMVFGGINFFLEGGRVVPHEHFLTGLFCLKLSAR